VLNDCTDPEDRIAKIRQFAASWPYSLNSVLGLEPKEIAHCTASEWETGLAHEKPVLVLIRVAPNCGETAN
jgi:hypothetical protein